MVVTTRIYTYNDLADTPDDGQRYEIIGGELFVSPSPILDHQRVLSRLHVWLANFVWEHELGEVLVGPTDVFFAETDVVVPDVLFVARDRSDLLHRRYVAGAPDLVIEVLSPKTRRRDLGIKKALCAAYGVAEYWIADPSAHTLEVWTLVEGGYELVEQTGDMVRSLVVPGFEVALADLFALM
ncbi:MAG: Uma2 family endonuclease [Chloroflexota bacterium]|nr:Uma2 family endonuclease [Chloroflexota bacterium]